VRSAIPKVIAAVITALVAVVLMSAPALALKDPFKPLVDPQAETGSTSGTGTGSTIDEPAVPADENPFSEGMPNTGADTRSWMVLAYVLVVAGAAALVLAWARRPAPARRQVFRS
jgi:hypothetical protein